MCGRYSVGVSPEELADVFEAQPSEPLDLPRWNVAPSQRAPLVVADRAGVRRLRSMRWGLVPRWAEDDRGPLRINARGESAATHGAFREAFARRRCLVPADGFYEWAKRDGSKQPFWIHHARGGLLAMAGLWERRRGLAGEPVEGFAILTTEPNSVVARIHSRMPVLIPPEAWSLWLAADAPPAALAALIAPAADDLVAARAVSPRVNRAETDDSRCTEAVASPLPEYLDLFERR